MGKQNTHIARGTIRRTIIWSAVIIGILGLWYLAVKRKLEMPVSHIKVSIQKPGDQQELINADDVIGIVEDYLGYDLEAALVRELDLRAIEAVMDADPRVHKAELFVDAKDRLQIYVMPKHVVARVKDGVYHDYYIDIAGSIVSATGTRPVRVPIVTGSHLSVPDSFPFNTDRAVLNEVFEVALAAAQDSFLYSLTEQIHIDSHGELWVIPKVGKERLLLGDAMDLEDRLDRLKIIYKEGMPRTGFNQYAELHFKWRGQVLRKK